jgi:hypothetical protein
LGQGLIAEIRKLQALLSEREETLKIVHIEKAKLDRHAENLENRIKALDDNEQRFKEENWNLELVIQDLQTQKSEHRDTETRMHAHIAQLEHEKNMIIKELDDLRQQHIKLTEEVDFKYKQHESEIGSLRRALATKDSERAILEQKVGDLTSELEESHNVSMRLRNMQERSDADERMRDALGLSTLNDDTPDHSPPPSPTKHTPRHGQLEAETLKSSLHHAHRMIQNLRSGIHREKSEKNELKRLLQETRDDLDTARNCFTTPPAKDKRRKGDGTFKKHSKVGVNLLGGIRKSRDEVYTIDPPADDDWEEAKDDSDIEASNPANHFISSAPVLDLEGDLGGDSVFETANERETTDAFETAHETDAYRTGAESPLNNDGPTSADDMTETEEKSTKTLGSKISALSNRTLRPVRLSRIRRESYQSTASTDEEDDVLRYEYHDSSVEPGDMFAYHSEGRYSEELKTPTTAINPRLKLRVNRARNRGSRIPSENSLFNTNMFSGIQSSPGSIAGSIAGSPYGGFRASTGLDMRKSLFAELGSSPGMLSTDSENVQGGTPGRKFLSPSPMLRSLMVDSAVMTEEPYPDTPILLDDSESDRPSTAATVVNDSSPLTIFGRKPHLEPIKEMLDVGVQWFDEDQPCFVESGTQSDEILVPQMLDVSVQFDLELGASDPDVMVAPVILDPIVPKEMSNIGTQFDWEIEAQKERNVADSKPCQGLEDATSLTIVSQKLLNMEPIAETKVYTSTPIQTVLEVPVFALVKGHSVEIAPVEVTDDDQSCEPLTFAIVTGNSVETAPVEEDSIIHSVPESSLLIQNDRNPIECVIVNGSFVETVPVEVAESNICVPAQESLTPTKNREAPLFAIVTGENIETVPVEVSLFTATSQQPPLFLDFSPLASIGTQPIRPDPPAPAYAPPPIPVEADVISLVSFEADSATAEITEVNGPRPSTSTPSVEQKSFFSSIFNSRKQASGFEPMLGGRKNLTLESDDDETIRKRDVRPRPAIPVPIPMLDQGIQTEPAAENILFSVPEDSTVQGMPIAIAVTEATPPTKSGAYTPSIQSRTSLESIGLGRYTMGVEGLRMVPGTARRPRSSSSVRDRMQFPPLPEDRNERIHAAQYRTNVSHEQYSMAPPPMPTQKSNVLFRPRTPGKTDQLRQPETPTSHGANTSNPPKFSATRSEISSPGSRRSSLSSFASELDDRFNMHNDGYPRSSVEGQSTDPRVIQAITQTMIGEYLWKYTRNPGRGTMSQSRHKRFFWIHPYTRTLYWSDRDPQSAGRAELRAKSLAIEAVRVVADDNPMPPGLHRKSLVIITPGRTLKFTAPTSQRHETWFNALSYLLLRDGQEGISEDDPAGVDDDDLRDYNPGYANANNHGASSFTSFMSRTTRDSSPARNSSSLSNRRSGEKVDRTQGSLSRLSSIFRPVSGFSTYGSRTSRIMSEPTEEVETAEDLHGQEEAERLENVRACCDGSSPPHLPIFLKLLAIYNSNVM